MANKAPAGAGWEVVRDLSVEMLKLAEAGDFLTLRQLDAERRRALFAIANRREQSLSPALAAQLADLQARLVALAEQQARAEGTAAAKAKRAAEFTPSV